MPVIAGARMSGSSGDAIIFVHGVGSTAAIWDRQLAAFADAYRCFAVELRGNGASQPDPDPATITREGFVRDVLAVADAAQADRFHLVGCSLGGVVGFELHRIAPQRLRSLTIVGSFARYADGEGYARGVAETVRDAGSMPAFARMRAERLGLQPGPRTDETVSQMGCKSVACYLASTNATWTGDYREDLSKIAVPALVMYGERDTVAPREYAREIAGNIPGAHLEVVPDAGHVANADAPEAFNRILRAFLEQLR
jgi:3-oxoadipate enol-lactonase